MFIPKLTKQESSIALELFNIDRAIKEVGDEPIPSEIIEAKESLRLNLFNLYESNKDLDREKGEK